LKTHRLLRQYFWLAVLPYTIATYLANNTFENQAERLWGIHANRLNNRYFFWNLESFLILMTRNIPSNYFQWAKYTHGDQNGLTNMIYPKNNPMKLISLLLLITQKSKNGKKYWYLSLNKMKVEKKEDQEKVRLKVYLKL
jgi:hypothetical protein